MKKTLFTLICAFCVMICNAQDVTTYSVYDTNQSGDVTVSDVTEVVDKVKRNVAAVNTQQYVTADELKVLLNAINSRLSELDSKLSLIQSSNTKITDNLGVTVNGHEYVDLGLSVKWATMNVGATEVAGSKINSHTGQLDCYGEYYAWGETSPKDSYDWGTYTLCNGTSSSMTKYCTSSSYGTVDNKTTLELSDDAAHANWGGSWRMPTSSELTELKNKCAWTWVTLNGVEGYKVTAANGNYIFFPATGVCVDASLDDLGSGGYCWSSSLSSSSSGSGYAYSLSLYSDIVNWGSNSRCYGRSVRAVCP